MGFNLDKSKDLNHNVRNALLGIALEGKVLQKCLVKIQAHLDRIDEVVRECLGSVESQRRD